MSKKTVELLLDGRFMLAEVDYATPDTSVADILNEMYGIATVSTKTTDEKVDKLSMLLSKASELMSAMQELLIEINNERLKSEKGGE